MSSTLSHGSRGTTLMTREQLKTLPDPTALSATHKPIKHIDLVDTIIKVVEENGLEVTSDSFAVNRHDIFGIMDINKESDDGDYGMAIGFRHGNAMDIGVHMTAGGRVFVCDNMMFSGDWEICRKKHTSGLNILDVMREGFAHVVENFNVMGGIINKLKARSMTDTDARVFLYDLLVSKATMPFKLAKKVHNEYFEPRHEEFRPRTAWSLTNAITEHAKALNPIPRMDLLSALGTIQRKLVD